MISIKKIVYSLQGLNMSDIKKIVCSLVAFLSFLTAFYFTFFVQQTDYKMILTWLVFSVFSFVFGWPETIKSISIFGNKIEIAQLRKEVSNLSALLNAYWREIKNQNRIAQDNTGLAIEINTQASFLTLDTQIEEKIQDVEGIALYAAKRLNGIWDEIIDFLKKNGVDTSEIESIPYYENSLYNPGWETMNVGLPNTISYLNLISTQMAIKHYESLVSSNVELSTQEHGRLVKLQSKLSKHAESILVD